MLLVVASTTLVWLYKPFLSIFNALVARLSYTRVSRSGSDAPPYGGLFFGVVADLGLFCAPYGGRIKGALWLRALVFEGCATRALTDAPGILVLGHPWPA